MVLEKVTKHESNDDEYSEISDAVVKYHNGATSANNPFAKKYEAAICKLIQEEEKSYYKWKKLACALRLDFKTKAELNGNEGYFRAMLVC